MPTHTQQITTEEAMNTMPLSTEGQMDSTSELEIYLDYLNKVDEAIRNFVKNVSFMYLKKKFNIKYLSYPFPT